MQPAGLWRRATARAIDTLCMLILYALTLAAVGFVLALAALPIAVGGGDVTGKVLGGGFWLLLVLLWVASAWMAVRRYEAESTLRCGQTLGKRLMGICVVRCLDTGGIVAEPPERSSSLLRWAIPHAAVSAAAVLLGVVLYVVDQAGLTDRDGLLLLLGLSALAALAWAACYVSALWGKDRRGWHDKAAGTVVVRATDEVLERLAAAEPAAREPGPKGRGADDPPEQASRDWSRDWSRRLPPP